jgi:hypothetical protein
MPMIKNENHKDILLWSHEYLLSRGHTLNNNASETVQNVPWSYVARFATSDGYIYLKHTPKLLGLEANITQILHDQFYASVPKIIAHNTELNCFLMKDAGKPLRQIFKKKFDVQLLCKAINQFTSLQLDVSDQIDVLLNIGVPDWSLDKLPGLFEKFLLQKDMLLTDGLSRTEINALKMLLTKISNLCKRLSEYSIKQTIVQPDFHDNNLLIDDNKNITIIDLGEIVISHPFFSLINCLQQAKRHHRLTDKDDAYLQLRDACIKNYSNFESKERLLDAFAIAKILLYVYGALTSDRLMKACGQEKLMAYQRGKLSDFLREFIALCDVEL